MKLFVKDKHDWIENIDGIDLKNEKFIKWDYKMSLKIAVYTANEQEMWYWKMVDKK